MDKDTEKARLVEHLRTRQKMAEERRELAEERMRQWTRAAVAERDIVREVGELIASLHSLP
jgi:hypothetical protein